MSNTSIKRKLIIVFMSEDNENNELFNDISLYFQAFDLKSLLRISNGKLQEELKAELPPLKVERVSKSYNDNMIFDDTCIRFCVHDSSKCIKTNNVVKYNSHVIEVSIGDPVPNKTGGSTFEYSVNIHTKDELYSIVEDVMLDIQMFYFFGCDQDFTSISDRKLFSLLKVEFCNSITNNKINTKYYSIATFCKNGSTVLDYNKYVKLWRDFLTYLSNKKPIIGSPSEATDVVDRIIDTLPYGKQISRNRLENKLLGLKPGKYLFVYLKTRPHHKQTFSKLQPLFSGTKLKRGSFEIVSYEMHCRYERYKRYINIYYFDINN